MMNEHKVVMIGSRCVGEAPVFIVAEAGVNHNGDIETAHRLVDAARDAGADAVKFQFFDADRLVSVSTPCCAYQESTGKKTEGQRAMLKRLELHADDLRSLKQRAQELGIEFLATPFGLPELRILVEQLDISAIKLASTDLSNVPLLLAAARTGRPLILSTGAGSPEEIDRAVDRAGSLGATNRIILLHCVSSYPTPLDKARLGTIPALRMRYRVPVGFSDHTVETMTGFCAILAGAMVLEKHLTLDREGVGPDHSFSLEPDQFATYVAEARRAEHILGDGDIGFSPEEAETRKLAGGKVVTSRALAAGERLTEHVLMIQRAGAGIESSHWDDVVGRAAKTDIPVHTPLTWAMIA